MKEGEAVLENQAKISQLKKYRLLMFVFIAICYLMTSFHRGAPAIMGPEL